MEKIRAGIADREFITRLISSIAAFVEMFAFSLPQVKIKAGS